MFRHIKLQSKTLINPSSPSFLSLSSFSSSSSSSSSSNDPPSPEQTSSNESSSSSSSSSSYSSYFSEIKERLKSPQPPPRRIPSNPPPPSFPSSATAPPAASLEEIRRHLAEFRLKSTDPPSGFQDLLKKDIFGKPGPKSEGVPFDSIRESLKKFRSSSPSSSFNIKGFQDGLRLPQLIVTDNLPDSIFGKERTEKKGEVKGMKTEFLKMYGYEELGEKLRGLRPAKGGEKDEFFSLAELNERLGKLRELEEKETESKMGGVSFRDLRESLQRLKDSDAAKKSNSGWFFCYCYCVLAF